MKKLIACASLAFAFVCTASYADDSATGNVTGSTTGNDMLQKGKNTADTASNTVSETSKSMTDTTKSMSKSADKWASASTCTDENGVLHSRGSSGFQSCVDAKKKMDTKREQGGTVGSSGSTTDTSPYGSSSSGAKGGMNDTSGSMSGTSSGSSGDSSN